MKAKRCRRRQCAAVCKSGKGKKAFRLNLESRKQAQKAMRIMLAIVLILLFLCGVFVASVYAFNHTLRQADSGRSCDDFTVTIAPRTGQTDSWPKQIQENGQNVDYRGTIYDITLNNTGAYNISTWTLRIDITQDVYLNNAWCGTFEIHQHQDGKERVQTLDLRNYSQENLSLAYTISGPDLLIPLHAGDYLVYHPDFAANEYPVSHGNSVKLTQVVFGAIFYNQDSTPIQFTQYDIQYYLQKSYTDSPLFWVLCLAFFAWIISLVSFACVEANMKNAHARFRQDEHIISQSIGVFTRFFEAKDNYTNGHSQRVANYSKMIAEKLGFTEDEVRHVYYIALMHDCGKCYIPDEILKKPGRLTDEEYETIKSMKRSRAIP
jgi:hypothetical protein